MRLPVSSAASSRHFLNGAVATREFGGAIMNAIAAALPELVGGSADLDPSTKTYLRPR